MPIAPPLRSTCDPPPQSRLGRRQQAIPPRWRSIVLNYRGCCLRLPNEGRFRRVGGNRRRVTWRPPILPSQLRTIMSVPEITSNLDPDVGNPDVSVAAVPFPAIRGEMPIGP